MPRTLPHSPAHCHTLLYVIYCYSCIIIYLLFSSAAHCRTLPHTAAHCRTLRHTAAHCLVLFLFLIYHYICIIRCRTLPHTAAHCCTVPCVVFCYLFIIIYSLFGVALCRALPHPVALCCTLLHTAAHCRMLFIVIY